MIEKIITQIVELDDKKPTQSNNYLSENYKNLKQMIIDASKVITFIDNINNYINYFNLSESLLINYGKNDSYEKLTIEEIGNLIEIVSNSISNLSKISSYDSLNNEKQSLIENAEILFSHISGLKDELLVIEEEKIKDYNINRNNLLEELKREIEIKLKEEENRKKEFLSFSNNSDFSQDLILYESNYNIKEDDLNKIGITLPNLKNYGTHNFSSKEFHNLLFLKTGLQNELYTKLFEDLFLRLLFHFDARLLEIQPVGILPLKLNAVLSHCKYGDYSPIKSAILDAKSFENYLASIYEEVTNRINKYKDFNSFYEYNATNADNQDKAIIIFLNDYPQITSNLCNLHIKNLLESDCYLYGVYFIVSTTDTGNIFINESENNLVDFRKLDYGFNEFKLKDNKVYLGKKEVSFNLYDESAKYLLISKYLN